jgi:hypothetical protein
VFQRPPSRSPGNLTGAAPQPEGLAHATSVPGPPDWRGAVPSAMAERWTA